MPGLRARVLGGATKDGVPRRDGPSEDMLLPVLALPFACAAPPLWHDLTCFPVKTSGHDPLVRTQAEMVFDWLRADDPIPPQADAAMGFGHFDLRVPRLCGELLSAQTCRRLLFTGGIGAGTGRLPGAEADSFFGVLQAEFPRLSAADCLVENRSTNTAENIRFSRDLAQSRGLPWTFGAGIKTAILVAHAVRLRRVRQTWLQLASEVRIAAIAPATDYATDFGLHQEQQASLIAQIVGEVERLMAYAEKGWIAPVAIPPDIFRAWLHLKTAQG